MNQGIRQLIATAAFIKPSIKNRIKVHKEAYKE
jgi:hypothetical protein